MPLQIFTSQQVSCYHHHDLTRPQGLKNRLEISRTVRILNKLSATGDKGWSYSLNLNGGLTFLNLRSKNVIQCHLRFSKQYQWSFKPVVILWRFDSKIYRYLLRIVVASSSGLSSPRRVLIDPEYEGNTTIRPFEMPVTLHHSTQLNIPDYPGCW